MAQLGEDGEQPVPHRRRAARRVVGAAQHLVDRGDRPRRRRESVEARVDALAELGDEVDTLALEHALDDLAARQRAHLLLGDARRLRELRREVVAVLLGAVHAERLVDHDADGRAVDRVDLALAHRLEDHAEQQRDRAEAQRAEQELGARRRALPLAAVDRADEEHEQRDDHEHDHPRGRRAREGELPAHALRRRLHRQRARHDVYLPKRHARTISRTTSASSASASRFQISPCRSGSLEPFSIEISRP